MSPNGERLVEANGVEICVEGIGDPGDPAILLIGGSGASMDWWEDEFCERLAAGRRFVIRYDHRDTGRSVTYEPGAPGYTSDDLVADAIGVLDALGVGRAHVVGISMGGGLAQVVALDHPDRVASLTLISTSPSGPDVDLPGMSAEAIARFAEAGEPDWSDRDAVVDHVVHLARASAGTGRPFDEESFRPLAERVVDRTKNMQSTMTNHEILEGGGRWRERLPGLELPTLVIHGTDDPVLPHPHGEALSREIPGAELLTLEGTGHELPRPTWDVAVPAILAHTSG
jgi:pimeloyl-ACP methyl ester carboxylesterase